MGASKRKRAGGQGSSMSVRKEEKCDPRTRTLRIAFPHRPGAGGPGSFQERIQEKFADFGWQVSYFDDHRQVADVVFVVGGTRQIFRLLRLKLSGVPILYRLDGILWMHRKQWPGLKKFITNELRNTLMKFTHGFIADHVVYQSNFVRRWWTKAGWRSPVAESVISNGVDLKAFCPEAALAGQPAAASVRRVICVEGNLDYSPYAFELLNMLSNMLAARDITIELYGGAQNPHSLENLAGSIRYHGPVPRSEIVRVYRPGVYLSLDVQAACPNTVIEAMSCGLPVVGFDTGALSELVPANCGRIVDYGSDPWQLAMPDVSALSEAILDVVENYQVFAHNALEHAQQRYGIEKVAGHYADLIRSLVSKRVDED
jgi:glycosyltransferase involved in cell wall biosynthesis